MSHTHKWHQKSIRILYIKWTFPKMHILFRVKLIPALKLISKLESFGPVPGQVCVMCQYPVHSVYVNEVRHKSNRVRTGPWPSGKRSNYPHHAPYSQFQRQKSKLKSSHCGLISPLFLPYLFKLFFKGPILLVITVPISRASASLFRLVVLAWVVTRGPWGWWGATFTRGSTLWGWARGKGVVPWLHVKTFLRLGGNGLDWSLNTTILLNDKTLGL